MAKLSIALTGGRELAEMLADVCPRLAVNLMSNATYAGAGYLKGLWSEAAPEDSGDLKRGIGISHGRRRGSTVVSWVGLKQDVYYGRFVELGTVHAPPHPWALPATSRGAPGAVQEMIDYSMERFETVFGTGLTRARGSYEGLPLV